MEPSLAPTVERLKARGGQGARGAWNRGRNAFTAISALFAEKAAFESANSKDEMPRSAFGV